MSAVLAVLVALLVPLVGRTRAAAQSAACSANLRQIGQAFLHYAADNDFQLPDPWANQLSWEQSLSHYLPDPNVFACPADDEIFPSVGSSYDWRDTGRPETTLAGRSCRDVRRGNVVLAFEALPGWHFKGRMNAVLLDGSSVDLDQETCLGDLELPVRELLGRLGDAVGKKRP